MTAPRLASALLLLATAAGCVQVNATRLGPGPGYAPVHPDDVLVYRAEADVEAGFHPVALIYVEGNASTTSEREMIRAARKKAGRLGANGVVVERFRHPSPVERIAGAVLEVPVERRAEFLAIRVEAGGEP